MLGLWSIKWTVGEEGGVELDCFRHTDVGISYKNAN